MAEQAKTGTTYGDPNAMSVQAAGLFRLCEVRKGVMNRLTGKMPTLADAQSKDKKWSSTDMPIVQCQDLNAGDGDEVKFQFVQPTRAFPIMGSAYAEGKGTPITYGGDRLRVNQARFPIDLGDTMTQFRTPHQFRKLGKPIAERFMNSYIDQLQMMHLCGARGNQDNQEWMIPLEQDQRFAEIAINRVKAPTKNRHYMASGSTIDPFGVNGGEIDITTGDMMTMAVVDAIASLRDQMTLPPPPVKFDGDEASEDSPLNVLMCSPAQYNWFSRQDGFRSWQASALARASHAKQHPIFRVDAGIWANTLIVKMPRPVRFYAGETIKYCGSYDSEVESSVIVPASFGTTHAVDRAVLLGGQALAQAWGRTGSGMPFNWSEKKLDHDDKVELLIGAVLGISKIRWGVNTDSGTEFTDHGVIAIDTAVPIIGARK